MKKGIFIALLASFMFAEVTKPESPKETKEVKSTQTKESKATKGGGKQTLIEKIVEKEKEHSVPRETVPVEEVKFLINTPIPKTAHYLPLLQPLFNIEVGTLPNPLGISLIGSYISEEYTITKFKGTLGANLGMGVVTGLLGLIDQKTLESIANGALIDQTIDTLIPLVRRDKDKIIAAIKNSNQLTQEQKTALETAIKLIGNNGLVGNIAVTGLKVWLKNQANSILNNPQQVADVINSIIGAGQQKEWKLSDGKVKTKTAAVGIKADMWILPFMNLFATATYLDMEQHTSIGSATLPLDRPIGNITSLTFPIGSLQNRLRGFAVMGGTNIAIGYKGFFASFMVSGGYVRLDDTQNNIKGFVEKPFMYLAPRIGYSYNGIFTIHTGVQRVELFGATEGKDLSKLTGGLVSNYSVEVAKFPVTFLAGFQFMFMRDLGLSVEYVGSPDTNGVNAEIAFRF